MRMVADSALMEKGEKPMEPIDRQAAIDALKPCAGVGNRALDKLRALPTVDAVEVVRCKDCKHRPAFRYYEDGNRYVEGPRYQETLKNGLTVTLEDTGCPCVNGWDSYFSYVPKDDWFCANGERRDDE